LLHTGAVGFVFAPLVTALACASVRPAVVTSIGVFVAVASATIQLCFRTQARRSQFRHRHVSSSRIATFAEASSSIAWAGTSALVAAIALIPALIAISILSGDRAP
jgi:ABC-2 type transport system permease protein